MDFKFRARLLLSSSRVVWVIGVCKSHESSQKQPDEPRHWRATAVEPRLDRPRLKSNNLLKE
jgi:hypothetical protein